MTLPLDGVLVADFSRVLAGPLATVMLADLGARVIKVERPGSGDDTRAWGPPWTEHSSSYFESANRSKESVTLDLTDPRDLDLARELARRADVMVENFRDGAFARFGLDHETVSRENPGVVYASITGFGARYGAGLAGYDFLVQAMGGLMSITGDADGDPLKVGVALVDVLTAKDATIGILAALRARESTGRGQRVEVNLLSSLLGSLVNQASSYLATGTPPGRMGNQHPSIAPYEALRCRDDLIAVACGNDGQFAKLVTLLGKADLATDERFASNPARVANRPALIAELEDLLAHESAAHWAETLAQQGIPAGTVGSVADGFALAERLGLDPLVEVDEAPPQVRHPIGYSLTPVTDYTRPPRLGEHDADVRRWLAEPAPEAGPEPTAPQPTQSSPTPSSPTQSSLEETPR